MRIYEIIENLCLSIRGAVKPLIGLRESAKIVHQAVSGDATFKIDVVAENALQSALENYGYKVNTYTEDNGLNLRFKDAEYTLVIDPIDGTRPAKVGFEAATICIAAIEGPGKNDAKIRDIIAAGVMEIKEDTFFYGEKNKGAKFKSIGSEIWQLPVKSGNTDINSFSWCFEIAGRPMNLVAKAIGSLVDRTGVRGGCFSFSSSSYSLTRLITGQLDAFVDVAAAILKLYPKYREDFLNAGCGSVIALFPYDFVAPVFLLLEAGYPVTTALGEPISEADILDSSEKNIQSLIAAENPILHENILTEVRNSIKQLSL